jgi:hypothetical protein
MSAKLIEAIGQKMQSLLTTTKAADMVTYALLSLRAVLLALSEFDTT